MRVSVLARRFAAVGSAVELTNHDCEMVDLLARGCIPRVTELSLLLTLRQLEWATSAAPVVFWGPSSCVLAAPVRSAIHARCFAQNSNA